MRVSISFRVSLRVRVSLSFRVSLRIRVSLRFMVSLRVSLFPTPESFLIFLIWLKTDLKFLIWFNARS